MARYSGFSKATTAADAMIWDLSAVTATLRRAKIYDIVIGSSTTADNAAEFACKRTTDTGGTPVAFTPVPLDPADGASGMTFHESWATDAVDTANSEMLSFGLNNRATMRWVAAPGGELTVPATNVNGIALLAVTVTTGFSVNSTAHWME